MLLLNFFAKFLPERKYQINNLISWDENIFRWDHKIYEFSNNKSPGDDGLTIEFYKLFSNELAPVLSDVNVSWGKLGTVGVTSRIAIISTIYKKGDEKDITNCRPISLLNL